MQQKYSFITNVLSGAIAGAIVSVLILQYPVALHNLFPQIPVPPITSSYSTSSKGVVISDSREQQIIATVQKAQKSVVSIVISQNVPLYEQSFTQPNTQNPFGDFFGNTFPQFNMQTPQLHQNGTQKQDIGGGSGFIVSADGLIITNKHVVDQDGAEYTVFLNDGTKYTATVIAR